MSPSNIDINVLRGMLEQTERMIPYYADKTATLETQNAAMKAAGLKPMHDERTIERDREHLKKTRAEAECLRAVVAHFERVNTPLKALDHLNMNVGA